MKTAIILISSVMMFGCAGEKTTTVDTHSKTTVDTHSKPTIVDSHSKEEATNMITITATVVFKELEGGFYGLDAEDGNKYLPQGMDKSLLKNGMKVRVTGYILSDMITFQQYGDVLKVTNSEMLDDSQVRQQNEY